MGTQKNAAPMHGLFSIEFKEENIHNITFKDCVLTESMSINATVNVYHTNKFIRKISWSFLSKSLDIVSYWKAMNCLSMIQQHNDVVFTNDCSIFIHRSQETYQSNIK